VTFDVPGASGHVAHKGSADDVQETSLTAARPGYSVPRSSSRGVLSGAKTGILIPNLQSLHLFPSITSARPAPGPDLHCRVLRCFFSSLPRYREFH
jgi:hypothetical protein